MDKLRNFFLFLTISLLMVAASYVGYVLAFNKLIYPRTSIAGIDVGGMDKQSALRLVDLYFQKNPNSIILRNNGNEIDRLDMFLVEHDFVWAVDQAMMVGRSGNILTRISDQVQSVYKPRDIQVPTKYDSSELDGILEEITATINQEPIWPSLKIADGRAVLIEGKNGARVKSDEIKQEIINKFSVPGKHLIDIPLEMVITDVSPSQANEALLTAQKWIGKKIKLKAREKFYDMDDTVILSILGLVTDRISSKGYEDLLEEIKPKLEVEPKDAVFVFENNKVKEFSHETVGTKIDVNMLKDKLTEVIYNSEMDSFDVPLILSYPKITTGEINNLGIKELIGKGESSFSHSIPGRVFNVNLAASRINGVIVPPGEVFSFNENVGEISRDTGYQSAYIISGGRTVLGDGGGVCQVSTTLFRSVLNAGLPVIERKAHAYRVGYYEQDSKPGLDATVFSPTADLKFKNDTGNHLLIQTKVDTKKMTMSIDIYGTSDGRKAQITDPKVTSQTPPPETMYVDDPTLALGVTKQIDWSAWGAKVSFDYTVERGGEVLFSKTFYSNYQPWQAVYLKGSKVN